MGRKRTAKLSKEQSKWQVVKKFAKMSGERVELKPNLFGALVLVGRSGILGRPIKELADELWAGVLTGEEAADRMAFRQAQKKEAGFASDLRSADTEK